MRLPAPRGHPPPTWNPDIPDTNDYMSMWQEVPDNAATATGSLDNGFKAQWEEYLTDVAMDRRHRFDLLSGAREVQLAELGLRSAAEGRRVYVPEIVVDQR